jgi:uncharacterized protein YifE (UPF0438 family)
MTPPEFSIILTPMKILLVLVVGFAMGMFPAFGGDWAQKEPAVLAKEAKEVSQNLRREAQQFQERAIKEARTLSADEKKYLELTLAEADAAEKAAAAWEKNQKRMAEKHREKAMELCGKRGELAGKLKLWDAPPGPKPPPGDKPKPFAPPPGEPKDKAAKLAEIERQQAELDRKKKELEGQPTPP